MKKLFLLLLLTGCAPQGAKLVTVNVIDQHGFNETITNKDRLANYKKVDFERPQPYQKVLRIYDDAQSIVTSYHPNGQLHRRLHIENGRAFGPYEEWFSNGQKKLSTSVIAGNADIDPKAMETYVFDNESLAWNEEGSLIAHITYVKGLLNGVSTYFYSSGKIEGKVPFAHGKREGLSEHFFEDGSLKSQINYRDDQLNGEAVGFWSADQVAYRELYQEGLLMSGDYFSINDEVVSTIKEGAGLQALVQESGALKLVEHQQGIPSGLVKEYTPQGELKRKYFVQNGLKEGQETEYYTPPLFGRPPRADGEMDPKIALDWHKGEMQGTVKTWFPNGAVESQREISQNRKNGMSMAWFSDGSLMMIEEYRDDRLVKGDYFSKGQNNPVSKVLEGKGLVTLYDAEGHLLRKIHYNDGTPSA